jgi:hypothetical protein
MAGQPYMVSSVRTRRFTITIPDTAAPAKTVESLVLAVAAPGDANDLMRVIGCKISGNLTVGTARPAFVAGDVVGTLPQYVLAGADWLEPSLGDYQQTFVKSAATPISAVVVLYIG